MTRTPRKGGASNGLADRCAEIIRFGTAGAVNTAFGFGIYAGLVVIGVDVGLSLFIATAVGAFFNFLTFGGFAYRQLDKRRLPRFLVVYSLIYLLNLTLLHAVRTASGLGPILAQIACLVVIAPTAYLLLKIKVFREMPDE